MSVGRNIRRRNDKINLNNNLVAYSGCSRDRSYYSILEGEEMRTKKEIEEAIQELKGEPQFIEALEWVLDGRKHKPIEAGNSYGIEYRCSHCDFPKNETLLWRDRYCWNCGCELDWSEWEEK